MDWTIPEYVGAVGGVLAVGAPALFASLIRSSPTVDDVTVVVLRITVLTPLAHEPDRRW